MNGLCLGLAGVVWQALASPDFTLAWQHSVEKIRWEEDYQSTPSGFVLVEARVRGSGAGMEVPLDARWEGGSWHYRPELPSLPILHLGRTPEAGDYDLCTEGHCQPMSTWLGPPDGTRPALELWPCSLPDSKS